MHIEFDSYNVSRGDAITSNFIMPTELESEKHQLGNKLQIYPSVRLVTHNQMRGKREKSKAWPMVPQYTKQHYHENVRLIYK